MNFRRRWMLLPTEIVRIIRHVEWQEGINQEAEKVETEKIKAFVITPEMDDENRQSARVQIQFYTTLLSAKRNQLQKDAFDFLVRKYPVMRDLNNWNNILDQVKKWNKEGGKSGRVQTPWVRIGALLNAVMPAGAVFAVFIGLTSLVYPFIKGGASAPLWIGAVVGLAAVAITALIIGLATSYARATKTLKNAKLFESAANVTEIRADLERLNEIREVNRAKYVNKKAHESDPGLFTDVSRPDEWVGPGPFLNRKLLLTPLDIVQIRLWIASAKEQYAEADVADKSAKAVQLREGLCEAYPAMRGLSWQEIGVIYHEWGAAAEDGYVKNFQYYIGSTLKVIFSVLSSFTLGYLATELIYTWATLGTAATSILQAPFWIGAIGGVTLMLLLGVMVLMYCLADVDMETTLEVQLIEMQENAATSKQYTDTLIKEQIRRELATQKKDVAAQIVVAEDVADDDLGETLSLGDGDESNSHEGVNGNLGILIGSGVGPLGTIILDTDNGATHPGMEPLLVNPLMQGVAQ